MVVNIKIFNENERVIKMIVCKIERLQKVLKENEEMILKHETTIEVMSKFLEEIWDKEGAQVMTEEYDGINSLKK